MYPDVASCGMTDWVGTVLAGGVGFLLLLASLMAIAALVKYLFLRSRRPEAQETG